MSDCTIAAGAAATLQGMTGSRVRCILVDDHPAIRVGVRSMLAAGHISVVGEAQSGEAAVELVARRLPDVVVMDVNLGRGMDGFAACREITVNDPRIGVVLLTGFGQRGYAPRALEHGARGYVLKHAPADDMVRAVRTVAAGGVYVDPVAALDLVAPAGEELSPRESEVLTLLQDGHRSSDIARRLFISKATVRSHVRNAMTKLNARTFTQAVAEAVRRSLISA